VRSNRRGGGWGGGGGVGKGSKQGATNEEGWG